MPNPGHKLNHLGIWHKIYTDWLIWILSLASYPHILWLVGIIPWHKLHPPKRRNVPYKGAISICKGSKIARILGSWLIFKAQSADTNRSTLAEDGGGPWQRCHGMPNVWYMEIKTCRCLVITEPALNIFELLLSTAASLLHMCVKPALSQGLSWRVERFGRIGLPLTSLCHLRWYPGWTTNWKTRKHQEKILRAKKSSATSDLYRWTPPQQFAEHKVVRKHVTCTLFQESPRIRMNTFYFAVSSNFQQTCTPQNLTLDPHNKTDVWKLEGLFSIVVSGSLNRW